MKTYRFNLDAHFVDQAFSPLRTKAQALVVLMKCIKLMLAGNIISDDKKSGELLLNVSKRSRLFLFSENKYFSIGFPFFVEEIDGMLHFSTKNIKSVDSKVTSDVISIISGTDKLECCSGLEFIEPVVDIEESEPNFWPFLLSLLMYEDGYVRYDHDPKHENGDLHPLNHYDFFYSSFTSCKVGLRNKLNDSEMLDLLSPDTACHYIEDAT